MSLIDKFIYGWSDLEPIFLASIATKHNVLLMGRHGIGKSACMQFIGQAMSDENEKLNVIKYSTDKENLISMVGIPNAEELKKGRIVYATHDRSIFNADIALMDEITRASKETQNMILEILQENTVFGQPLKKLKFVVATANDETYKGAMRLDAALLDRFACVLPVPDLGSDQSRWGSDEIEEIIRLNLFDREVSFNDSSKELRKVVMGIKEETEKLWQQKNKNNETELADNVIDFTAKFFTQLLASLGELNKNKKSDKFYISIRQVAQHFPLLTMATASYFKIVKDDTDYLKSGA